MKYSASLFKPTLLLLVLFHGLLTFAQTPTVWIGVQGGPAYNSFRGNEGIENFYDPALGFMTGLTLDHHFTPVFSFVSSLNYEQKRIQGTLVGTDETGQILGDIDYRATYQYLTWPLLARGTFGEGFRFFVNGGPYLGFLLKQTEKMETTWNDMKVENDHTGDFKTFEFGVVAGIGGIFPVGDHFRITLELRDHLGLTNISALEITNDGSIKTNALIFLVGLSYGLGGEGDG
jgi:hypothetical protein